MKILHLYHDIMNLYGDYGNISVLSGHLADQGLEVTTEQLSIGDEIDFSRYDMIYIGPGTEKRQETVRKDLMARSAEIVSAVLDGRTVLATGNAMELFGDGISGRKCLGLVPMNTVMTDRRYTGDVIVTSPLTGPVAGYINRSTVTDQDAGDGLFTYLFRAKGLPRESSEGYRYMDLFGTHLIGPVLTKNPLFLEALVKLITEKAGKHYEKISYPLEESIYRNTMDALKKRKRCAV